MADWPVRRGLTLMAFYTKFKTTRKYCDIILEFSDLIINVRNENDLRFHILSLKCDVYLASELKHLRYSTVQTLRLQDVW